MEHFNHLESHFSLFSTSPLKGFEESRFALFSEEFKRHSSASLLKLKGAVQEQLNLRVKLSNVIVLFLSEPL